MTGGRWLAVPAGALLLAVAVACGSTTAPNVGAGVPSTEAATPVEDAFGITIGPPTSSPGRFGPDGSGTLTGVGATSTVDTDGDGKADAFRVPVEVTVSNPGTWSVVLDLSQDGEKVLSAPGTAELQAGSGVVNVDVPADELLFVGASGTFDVTNVVLADWSDGAHRMAAQVDRLGRTGSFRLSEISLPKPTLPWAQGPQILVSRPTVSSVDSDKDGRLDILRVTGKVTIESAGHYVLSAWLAGESGPLIGRHEETLSLAEGRPSYRVDFPGELIGTHGSGKYTIGVRLATVDGGNFDEVDGVQTDHLTASEWVG